MNFTFISGSIFWSVALVLFGDLVAYFVSRNEFLIISGSWLDRIRKNKVLKYLSVTVIFAVSVLIVDIADPDRLTRGGAGRNSSAGLLLIIPSLITVGLLQKPKKNTYK
jgi:hypothetical protein